MFQGFRDIALPALYWASHGTGYTTGYSAQYFKAFGNEPALYRKLTLLLLLPVYWSILRVSPFYYIEGKHYFIIVNIKKLVVF